MKKLLLAVVAVVGLTACFNEEVVRVQDSTAINFQADWVDHATRADKATDPSITTNNITGFDVWGFMDQPDGVVFNREEVSGSKETGFSYTNTQYWAAGHDYYFAALAPAQSENVTIDTTYANQLGLGVVNFTNVDGTEDLLYSAVGPVAAPALGESEVVEFTFSHLLSKIKFTFKNGFSNKNAYLDVKNIRINDVPANANVVLNKDWWSANPWTDYQGTTDLEFGDACDKISIGDSQESDFERFTIPAPATQNYEVVFEVALYQGNRVAYEGTKTVVVENVELQRGKAYNFKTTLTSQNITEDGKELMPIEFDVVAVEDWVTAGTPDEQVEDAELRAAAQFGGEITLEKNVVLSAPIVVKNDLVVDLNGHNLSCTADVFEVAAGSLTIKGEGEVFAASENGTPYCAVWAYGDAVVNIYGGDYKVGYPTGDYNDLIYAKENAVINIYGGKFYHNGWDNAFVLNLKDGSAADINVYGGAFEKFNPANNNSEGANTNFVADGLRATQLGDWYYVSDATLVSTAAELQAALDAAVDGDKIAFVANIEGDVVATQKADVKITLDGAGYEFAGVITVDGKSATYTTAGLAIKNVNFVADAISADACIRLGDGTKPTRYTCNVTVEGCTFDVPGAVGVKSYTGGDKNLVIKESTATANAHSLLQAAGIDGILVEKCTVNSKNGLNFNASTNVVINECTVDTKGYCARFGSGSGAAGVASYEISNSSLKSLCDEGDAVIVLRATTVNSTLNLVNTTLEGDIKFTNAGAKVYVDGALM
ncbi:MAG: fimbrillin family protein [Alistipes sp.]|nr:fimbrillin family protein [Alistipes sp.]